MAYKNPEDHKAYNVAYREANREKIRQWHRDYYARNAEKRREATRCAYEKNREVRLRHSAAYSRAARWRRRLAVFQLLGNKCVRCGFDDPRALQIDHVAGGGTEERRNARSTAAYYDRILAVGAAEYQILCANCNQIKRYENGERCGPSKGCPIELEE
jgi:hypothetical protein